MATKLARVKLANGEELMVEVDEPPTTGVKAVSVGRGGEIEFGPALENVKSAAGQLLEKLREIAVPPDSCEISFGIKLSASAGVILAKAGTEANFTIKMSWAARKSA